MSWIRDLFSKRDKPPAKIRTVGPTSDDGTFFLTNRLLAGKTALARPYAQHPWIYAAIQAVATPFRSSPIMLDDGNTDDPNPITAGPVWDLLRSPNPDILPGSMLYGGSIVQLLTTGEAIWLLYRRGVPVQRPNEIPDQIYLCGRGDLEPVLSRDAQGRAALPVRAWKRTDADVELPTAAVLRFRLYNPYSILRGLAPLEAVLLDAGADFASSAWSQKFFENGAMPGAVLHFPSEIELDANQVQQYLETWESRHQGPDNAGRLAIVDRGGQLIVYGKAHEEMDWVEVRRFTREEINAVFGVTMFDLGVVDDVNRETAEQARRRLYVHRILPLQRDMLSVLQERIDLWQPGARVVFDNSDVDVLQESKFETLAPLDRMTAALQFQALGYDVNDINFRLGLGMPDIVEEPEPEPEPPDNTEDAERIASLFGARAAARDTIPEGFSKSARDRLWRNIEAEVLDPGERRMRRLLRRFFGELRAEQLRRFEESRSRANLTQDEIEGIIFNLGEWQDKLVSTLHPAYQSTAIDALSQLAAEHGMGDIGLTRSIDAFIEGREIKVRNVMETVRRQLRRVLIRASNETVPEVAAAIKKFFNQTTRRSVVIARTETANMTNGARFISMQSQGVLFHQWSNSKDEKVRPSHRKPTDGTVVRIGDRFPNGLLHPNDPNGPAHEVIQCRCVALPILEDDLNPQATFRAETSEEWAESFSDEENEAWSAWTRSHFDGIRRVSKTGTFDPTRDEPDVVKWHDTITRSFDRAPLFRGRVWRGMAPLRDDFDQIVQSGEMRLNALASSTVDEAVARRFAQGTPPGDRVNVLAIFDDTKTAIDTRALSVRGEGEIVLVKGSRYRLVRSVRIDDQNWEMHFEEIG